MDLIRFCQRVYGKFTTWHLFQITPARYNWDGVEPDPMRERQKAMGRRFGLRFMSRAYEGLPGRVHVHDTMLQSGSPEEIEHYRKVGLDAIRNIDESLAAGGKSWGDVRKCLDMACGYGRVLRQLRQKLRGEQITACELEEQATAFVAAEFGVRPLASSKDFREIKFNEKYDLIWVGSLFSHLPPPVGLEFIEKLIQLLNPGGIVILTTQGASCLEHIPFYGFMFEKQVDSFKEQMATQQWAYHYYYADEPGYGIAMYQEEFLKSEMEKRRGGEAKMIRFAERGWDNHQDVWAWQKQ